MKKSIITTLFVLAATFSTTAIANQQWTDSYQQDTSELYVQNAAGASIAIDCTDHGDGFPDKLITITDGKGGSLDSDNDTVTILFRLNGSEYQMINPNSRVGMSNWSAFFAAASKLPAGKTLVVTTDKQPKAGIVFPTDNLKALVKSYAKGNCFN